METISWLYRLNNDISFWRHEDLNHKAMLRSTIMYDDIMMQAHPSNYWPFVWDHQLIYSTNMQYTILKKQSGGWCN